MSKYYRVRTQEQWDWLMKWFEEQEIKWRSGCSPTQYTQTIIRSVLVEFYNGELTIQLDCGENAVEVSQMMEDEKMEDYVTIHSGDLEKVHWETNYGHTSFIDHDENGEKYAHEQYFPANLSIPKSLLYPKIQFTEAEKKEFDWLKEQQPKTLGQALEYISEERAACGTLYSLFEAIYGDETLSELEFARAWADPSLIEVIPDKKWNVRVPISNDEEFYKKDSTGKVGTVSFVEEYSLKQSDMQFTAKELKQYGLDNDLFEKVEVSE